MSRSEKFLNPNGSDPYQNLANAIVAQAADDYRSALRYLKKRPYGRAAGDAEDTVRECEAFFRSQYFELLTDLDGEALLNRLRGEINGS